jgi:hypothetical protein
MQEISARLRLEIFPHQQEANCFFQDCELDACNRAAVADDGGCCFSKWTDFDGYVAGLDAVS